MNDLAGREQDGIEVLGTSELSSHDSGFGRLVGDKVNVIRADHHQDRHSFVTADGIGELSQFGTHHTISNVSGEKVGLADEFSHKPSGREVIDELGGVQLFNLASVQHGDAIGHGKGFFVVVGDQDGRRLRSTKEGMEFLSHAAGHVGVEIAEWLVQEEQNGAMRQCSRECHSLLLPTG